MIRFVSSFIQYFDFFPKFGDERQSKNRTSSLIGLISIILIFFLSWFRIKVWIYSKPSQRFEIAETPYHKKLEQKNLLHVNTHFDIHFMNLPCAFVGFQVIDLSKQLIPISYYNIRMERFDSTNTPIFSLEYKTQANISCGSCYNLPGKCCNTCDSVRMLHQKSKIPMNPLYTYYQCFDHNKFNEVRSESCRVHGILQTPQVPSFIVFSPGNSLDHIDFFSQHNHSLNDFNMSHKINHFNIGADKKNGFYPLDKLNQKQEKQGRLKQTYYVKVVPVKTNMYRNAIEASFVQSYGRNNQSLNFPYVGFRLDFSPIGVVYDDKSIMNLLVELAYIIGGIYAIASFADLIAIKIKESKEYLPKIE